MYRIMILSNGKDRLSSLAKAIDGHKIPCKVQWETSLQKAMESLGKDAPELVLIDENVGGVSNIEAARQIVIHNAWINLAVISGFSGDEFHETFEGLGILARVSNPPEPREADRLIRHLDSFLARQP